VPSCSLLNPASAHVLERVLRLQLNAPTRPDARDAMGELREHFTEEGNGLLTDYPETGGEQAPIHDDDRMPPKINKFFARYTFMLSCLVPRFPTASSTSSTSGNPTQKKVHATAWLDGLRGWAAFNVFFHHAHYLLFASEEGWGVNDGARQWWRLPIVHTLFGGHTAVSVFFVVSGFTLSVKPITQMRKGDRDGLLTTLGSATFRRPVRLYGPVFASTFMVFLLGRLGMYAYAARFMPGFTVTEDKHYKQQADAFLDDFWQWLRRSINFYVANVDHWSSPAAGDHIWNTQMWTIPVEFRCSFALYLTQLALGRFSPRSRMLCLTGLIIMSVFQDWWAMMLFWSGMLLCEVHVEYAAYDARTDRHNDYISSAQASSNRLHRYIVAALHALNLFSALWLLSIPQGGCENTPGFKTLCRLTPKTMNQWWWVKYRFWGGVGAIQLVAGAAAADVALPWGRFSLSTLLSSPLSRYLGNISYALYCTHKSLIHTVGIPVWYAIFQITGRESGWHVGFFICLIYQAIVCFWFADVFWRYIDKPSVTLARKLEIILL